MNKIIGKIIAVFRSCVKFGQLNNALDWAAKLLKQNNASQEMCDIIMHNYRRQHMRIWNLQHEIQYNKIMLGYD